MVRDLLKGQQMMINDFTNILALGVLDSDVLQFVATHLEEGKYLSTYTSLTYSVDLSPWQSAICSSQLMLITDCYIHGVMTST